MDLILAGMNLDTELINDFKNKLHKAANVLISDRPQTTDDVALGNQILQMLDSETITPETVAAAYARISRDPRPVNQLREEARKRVGKARRSNRTIIFGLGHSSVAEHAVFNLDIIGVSRLMSEFLQNHRLCSFTEKSQRYIKLDQDYIIPEELVDTPLADSYKEFTHRRFKDYNDLCDVLKNELGHDESLCGEDARYVLPLSVTTQMGMTVNARSMEKILQETACSDLLEYQSFGKKLFSLIDGIAPSIIKYTTGNDLKRRQNTRLQAILNEHSDAIKPAHPGSDKNVRLIYSTPDGDRLVAQSLLWKLSTYPDEFSCEIPDLQNNPDLVKQIFLEIFDTMESWDSAPREFENAETLFEMVISAAAYAQMKRHRMATILTGPYDSRLGIIVPPALKNTRGEAILQTAALEAQELVEKIKPISKQASQYAFLSCHQRRLLVKMNARELIHLSRLREDQHAQWDIRNIAKAMVRLASEELPCCMTLACGKHQFKTKKQAIEK